MQHIQEPTLLPLGGEATVAAWQLFTLSAVAPALAVLFTNPFDTAKVRLQLQGEKGSQGRVYSNSWDCLIKTFKNEGIRGLQRGLTPAILREGSKNIFRIGMYEPILNMIHDKSKGAIPPWKRVLAGSACGAMGALACNPFELVKTRLQSQVSVGSNAVVGHQHGYRGVGDAFYQMLRKEGVRGLYKGSTMSVVRGMLGSGSNLSVYSGLKDYLIRTGWGKDSLSVDSFCGLASGLATVTVMNPVDVLRTRVYNQPVEADGKTGKLYKNGLDAFVKVWKNEGPTAFYKGYTSHFLRIGPHFCLTFAFLGVLKRGLYDYLDEKNITNAFRSVDVDGNGRIDENELLAALKAAFPVVSLTPAAAPATAQQQRVPSSPVPVWKLGPTEYEELMKQYVRRLFEKADTDRSGFIELQEYKNLVKEIRTIVRENELRAAFNSFDLDGNGVIDASDIFTVLKELMPKEMNVTQEQWEHELKRHVEEMMQYADLDHSQGIDFNEFSKVCNQMSNVKVRGAIAKDWMARAGVGHE
jgi:Ca2+-binding EF-hand superfamily protein